MKEENKNKYNTEVLCQVHQWVNNSSLDSNVQQHLQTQITGIKCDARELGPLTPHRRIIIRVVVFKWKVKMEEASKSAPH